VRAGGSSTEDVWHPGLVGRTRVRLLTLLRQHREGLDARQLARSCGVHVTTVRFHLDVLRQAGLVTSWSASGPARGRPRLLYALTEDGGPSRDGGPPRGAGYELLARVLAEHFDDDPALAWQRAEQAGEVLARNTEVATSAGGPIGTSTLDDAVGVVAARFDALGFSPQVSADTTEIVLSLHSCPFESVARAHPQVVCALHLGLLRGTLQRLRAPTGPVGLEPFARRGTCVARIGRRPTGNDRGAGKGPEKSAEEGAR
jgi:predicted ArsR family transcriptional regulator